jgi:nicotinamidase-related amidase
MKNPLAERPWPTPPPSFAVEPSRSALILIDFQRMQCERGCGLAGRIEREFPDIADYFFDRLENTVIPAAKRVLTAAREQSVPIFFLTIGPERHDGGDLARWKRERNRKMESDNADSAKPVYFWNGTEEHGLIAGFQPDPGEVVLNKTTFSGLLSTSLDMSLRALGCDTVFIAGQATNVCVQATAQDAADRGYQCVLIEDACAAWDPELHSATIRNFGMMYGAVATSTEAAQLLRNGGVATGRAMCAPAGGSYVYAVDAEISEDEDAFDDWYSNVHVPEVMACPGFLSAKRWRSADGSPRFLAVYELEGPWALETPELAAVRGWKDFEPFVTARTGVFRPIIEARKADGQVVMARPA